MVRIIKQINFPTDLKKFTCFLDTTLGLGITNVINFAFE